MALIKCPECWKKISDKATVCTHCGYPLNYGEAENKLAPKEMKNDVCESAETKDSKKALQLTSKEKSGYSDFFKKHKKIIFTCFAGIITIVFSAVFCVYLHNSTESNVYDVTTESTTIFANTLPKLEPNLGRLQGCWAASENYEDDEPNFLCAMPATWDENMKGYYLVEINGNTLLYRWFHPSGNNGSRNGDYEGWIEEEEYKIKKVTEVSSDKYQTQFTLDLISNDMPKQISIVVYDNSDIYKNSFMVNDFKEFMFVKLNDNQLVELMNTMYKISIGRENIDEPLFPYVGMSKGRLGNSSWGEPDDINIKTIKDNTFEQWCYPNNRYIYVENGYVKTIQM